MTRLSFHTSLIIPCAISALATAPAANGAAADRADQRTTNRCEVQGLAGPVTLRVTPGDLLGVNGPALTFNAVENEFAVTWGQEDEFGNVSIMMTLVPPAGDQATTATRVAESKDFDTVQSNIAHNPVNNRYFVTWRSVPFSAPPADYFNHLFGRMVSAAGLPDGPFQHLSHAGMESSVIYNSVTDDFLAVGRSFAGGPLGVYSRRVSGDGQPQDSSLRLNQPEGDELPSAAPMGRSAFNSRTGEYLTTWRDQDNGRLMGRLLDSQGQPASDVVILNNNKPGTYFTTGAAYDPINNRYLVVFNEFNGGDGGQILGQFVNADGSPANAIVIETATSQDPDIAFDPINEVFLVAWRHADYHSVTGQLLALNGDPLGEPIILSEGMLFDGGEYTGGSMVSVAPNTTSGGFLVAWRCYAPFIDFEVQALARAVNVTCEGGADLNGDGSVDVSDLLILLGAWGVCDGSCPADLNGDDIVNVSDMLELLAAWG